MHNSIRRTFRSTSGFSLTDMMITVAVSATLMAMAVPALTNVTESMRLGMAQRDVERELQTARLKAVSTNRTLRVRFRCPGAQDLRIVQVTGVASIDAAVDRCSQAAYPYPPATRSFDPAVPTQDGPIRTVHSSITLPALELQFAPDGRTQQVVAGTPTPIATTLNVTLTKGGASKIVVVNALGKITVQ